VGGIADEAFVATDPELARRQARAGLEETGARRWITAGGCTIPIDARTAAIDAVRDTLVADS
jgi:hypothetical protein